ncbi:topology modulation protein [Bacillus sp. RG28]|uniref:Topology modulation protein n=1 Tax=Gottfriedia endophytica TaxID=2820819 RepID=A0A940NPL3_9BACI|nr:topology modulation protein [Gottfriedia endophytica]MBP0725228.1 topology modulation protein [Gottfriedia endophytica]
MNRIMVLGVSPGVGKSTFARRLSDIIKINVYHLDTMYWKPGWIETSLDEFRSVQKKVVENRQWIIEGNYTNTYEVRIEKADTIIYLELPLYVCLYRVFKRFFQHIGKTRPDMTIGCDEKLDWKFIKFILTTYKNRKIVMRERLDYFLKKDAQNKIVILKSKKEIQDYLDKLSLEYNKN